MVPKAGHIPYAEKLDDVDVGDHQFRHAQRLSANAIATEAIMKVTMFHLMPYPRLPDEVIDAARQLLGHACPTRTTTRRSATTTYNRYLDELELCDELGFDGIASTSIIRRPTA